MWTAFIPTLYNIFKFNVCHDVKKLRRSGIWYKAIFHKAQKLKYILFRDAYKCDNIILYEKSQAKPVYVGNVSSTFIPAVRWLQLQVKGRKDGEGAHK